VGGTLDGLGRVLCDQGDLVAGRAYLDRAHAVLEATLRPEYRDNRAVTRRLEGP
jgi:hypothetical protein